MTPTQSAPLPPCLYIVYIGDNAGSLYELEMCLMSTDTGAYSWVVVDIDVGLVSLTKLGRND